MAVKMDASSVMAVKMRFFVVITVKMFLVAGKLSLLYLSGKLVHNRE